jgi:hypothetical protein
MTITEHFSDTQIRVSEERRTHPKKKCYCIARERTEAFLGDILAFATVQFRSSIFHDVAQLQRVVCYIRFEKRIGPIFKD